MKKARVSAMMLILVSFSIVGVYAYDPPREHRCLAVFTVLGQWAGDYRSPKKGTTHGISY